MGLSDIELDALHTKKDSYLDPFWDVLQKHHILNHIMLLTAITNPTKNTISDTLPVSLFSQALAIRKNDRNASGYLTGVTFRQSPKS